MSSTNFQVHKIRRTHVKYMVANPSNVMVASFNTTGLSTSKSMFVWREELRGADWDFRGEDISNRIAVLIGVDNYFRKLDANDMTDRLHIVTEHIVS